MIATNKASGGDGIPAELVQILNDDAVKVLLPMAANLHNSAVATGWEKVSFRFNPKEGKCQRMFKLPHNCTHFTCEQDNAQNPLRQASVYTNQEHPDIQAGYIHWMIEKTREFQKKNTHILMLHIL